MENIEEIPKEHLFEKPLTPSDVGKLNRLVIPKQHAEKYFPLNSSINVDNEEGEKGYLLKFEDESGKLWKFRYSYWNSSQSYVLTKGWSRFVKEKKLDAGDVILFDRHRVDGDRVFIGWRRRNCGGGAAATTVVGGGSGWGQVYCGARSPAVVHAGRGAMQNQGGGNGNYNTRKQVRLFGVNLECEVDESTWSEPSTPDGSLTSSHHHHHHQNHETPDDSLTSSHYLHHHHQSHDQTDQAQASRQNYYQYQNHYSNHNDNMIRPLFY